MKYIFTILKGAVPRVLFTIMHASMHASKMSIVPKFAPTSPAKMLSFYWDEDGVQRRQDIGYNKFGALKAFLIDSRHEDCCYHSFGNKRWFFCKQGELEKIFGIDSEYTTFFFIEQDHAFDEIRGNLACYTEEQLRNMDAPGTVLKMPNNLNRLLNHLRVLPQLDVLPETARQCFEFWINFEITNNGPYRVEATLHLSLYYDNERSLIVVHYDGGHAICVLEDYCCHHSFYNILTNRLELDINHALPCIRTDNANDPLISYTHELMNKFVEQTMMPLEAITECTKANVEANLY